MGNVRTAVIGVGDFGARHLDILSHMPGVEVAAIVDVDPDRLHAFQQRYDVPQVFSSVDDLFASVELDTVHIATPDTQHLKPALAAFERGIDVFLEKPISFDLGEARQIIDTAKRLRRKLMVGHILRFNAACAAIKERVTRGDLGKVATVYGRRNMARFLIPRYRYSNRLYTGGVHDIDLILWYFEGRQPVEVYMKTMNVLGQGDDVFWGMITMDDGSLGIIESNWLLPDATPWRGHVLLEVIGTEGTALAEVPGNPLTFWTDKVEIPDTTYWPVVHGATVGALRDEIAYFYRCVAEDQPITIPDPEDAYRGLRVAEALIRSSQIGQPVRLD